MTNNNFSKCRSCKADIVWMVTKRGKKVPVNAESYHGEPDFIYGQHIAHFTTCPYADDFRKDKSNG